MTTIMKEDHKLEEIIREATAGLNISTEEYEEKAFRMISNDTSEEQMNDILVKNALENIDESTPDWTYVASRIYLRGLYSEAAKNRQYNPTEKYGRLLNLINILTEKGIYSPLLLEKYTEEEINYFSEQIIEERDQLFDYLGLYTVATRYLATDHEKRIYEIGR